MHAFVTAVLLRLTRFDELGEYAKPHPPSGESERRARVLVANGTPLSVRIRCGSPNSLKSRVNTGFASTTEVFNRPWQLSRYRLYPSVTVSGIAVAAVARFELALVIGAPQLVRCRGDRGGFARVADARRRRFLGTKPWRLRISQTVLRWAKASAGVCRAGSSAASWRPNSGGAVEL